MIWMISTMVDDATGWCTWENWRLEGWVQVMMLHWKGRGRKADRRARIHSKHMWMAMMQCFKLCLPNLIDSTSNKLHIRIPKARMQGNQRNLWQKQHQIWQINCVASIRPQKEPGRRWTSRKMMWQLHQLMWQACIHWSSTIQLKRLQTVSPKTSIIMTRKWSEAVQTW